MPRKKKHGKAQGGRSSGKHSKHPKHAGAGPPQKGSKKGDDETKRAQILQSIQEMFAGKLDSVLVHMIMQDCNYNVNAAMETLFSLANDVPGDNGIDLDLEKARQLVGYDDTDDEDSDDGDIDYDYDVDDDDDDEEEDEVDGTHGAVYPPDGLIPDASIAESASVYNKPPISFSSGVGLDDFNHLPKIKGLDMAIGMTNQLDRNAFAEESVQQISAGLKAYRRTGDPNEVKKLGTLSAVAEMLLEVGAKEEVKEEEQERKAAKVRYKHSHSRLPVYSATDDRLVGGMTSSSESSSPNNSDEDQSDSPPPLIEGTTESDGPPLLLEGFPDSDGPPLLVDDAPTSGNAQSNFNAQRERIQDVSSLQDGGTSEHSAGLFLQNEVTNSAKDGHFIDQVFSGQVLHNPMTQEEMNIKSEEPDQREVAKLCQITKIPLANELEKGRSNMAEAPEEAEKDQDKDIRFKEDAEEHETSRMQSESSGQEAVHFDNSIRNPTDGMTSNPDHMSQHIAEQGRQSRSGANPSRMQFAGNAETNHYGLPMQDGPIVGVPMTTHPRSHGFESGNAPMNYPAGFNQGSKLLPGFSFPAGSFPMKNITPGLFPRMGPSEFSYFSKPQGNQQTMPAPAPGFPPQPMQQAFPGTFHMGQEQRGDVFANPLMSEPLFGHAFGLPQQSPAFPPPQSVQAKEEALVSSELPIEPTLAQEELGSQKQWPQIRHTNIRRNQYPAPSPRSVPPLPPGRVLCLMRGCPGSGKSFLAKRLRGNGVILSTDDFYMVNEEYRFDHTQVGEAHDWNKRRAEEHLKKGSTPILIDNTNIMSWEMKPYVALALKHKYQVVFREADTPWRNKIGELTKRNSHGVPRAAIARMLQNFECNVTVESVMNAPDRKKTPEFVAKLNEDESSGGRSGDGKSAAVYDKEWKQMIDNTKESRGGKSDGDAMGAEEERWDTVGKKKKSEGSPRGQNWNQQRGQARGRGGWRGGQQGRDVAGGSPRRQNDDHPSTRVQPRGNNPHGLMHSDLDKNKSPKRSFSPANHSPEKSVLDKNGQRRDVRAKDGSLQDARSASSSPKRGRVSGPSGPASPHRGSEQRRNNNADRGGKSSQFQKSSSKQGGRRQYDEAISFLGSGGGLSGDPMTDLKVDFKISDSVPEKGKKGDTRMKGGNQNNDDDELWETVTGKRSKGHDGHMSSRAHGRRRDVGIVKTNTQGHTSSPPVLHVRPLAREEEEGNITPVDSQRVEIHIQGKVFGANQGENLSGNSVSAKEFPHKSYNWDDSNMDRQSEQNVPEPEKENLPKLGHDALKTVKNLLTIQEVNGQKKDPMELKQEVLKGGISDLDSCAASGIPSSREDSKSSVKHEHEDVSPRSTQSSRSSTPIGKHPFRRTGSGCKSRRLAAVFTSPTGTTETSAPDTDWAKNDPSRSIPKSKFPATFQAIIPKQTVIDQSTLTEPQDFAVVQRIADGTMGVSDLPVEYLIKSANASYKIVGEGVEAEQPTSREPSPIPHVVKLHKSCMTEEVEEKTDSVDDKVSMMQLCFPGTDTSDLQNILETCGGDVDWATNILLDSISQAGPQQSAVDIPENPTSDERMSANNSSNRSSPLMSERSIIEEDISRLSDFQGGQTERSETIQEIAFELESTSAPVNTSIPDESQHVEGVNERMDPVDDSVLPLKGDLQVDKLEDENAEVPPESKQNPMTASNIILKDDTNSTQEGGQEHPKTLDERDVASNHGESLQSCLTKENDCDLKSVEADLDDASKHQDVVDQSKENNVEHDSLEFEEFSNNFTSGKSQILSKSSRSCSTVGTTDDEMPALESYSMDKQLMELATAVEKVGHGVNPFEGSHHVEESLVVATETTVDSVSKPTESVSSSDHKVDVVTSSEKPLESDRGASHLSSQHKEFLPEEEPQQIGDKDGDAVVEEQKSTTEVGLILPSTDNTAATKPDQSTLTGEIPESLVGSEDAGLTAAQREQKEKTSVDHGSKPAEVSPTQAASASSSSQPECKQQDIAVHSSEKIVSSYSTELPIGYEETRRAGNSGDRLNFVTCSSSHVSGIVQHLGASADAGAGEALRSNSSDDTKNRDFQTVSPVIEQAEAKSSSDSVPSLKKASSESESTENEEPDEDIPWKSEFMSPTGTSPRKSTLKEEEKTRDEGAKDSKDSGEAVYEYLGGMVLQMDTAFALQLQEIFGPVGFHLTPDALSPEDLNIRIGYQLARQLHQAWSSEAKERFQSQERQMEEMLQRDEELARRLQQEENLKKLAKAHRDKKPTKFVSPGSPKRSRKKQKDTEISGLANGGTPEKPKGENIVVGGGIRLLGELGVVGGAEMGVYPPPVQRMEVPDLARIMAEEETIQKKHEQGSGLEDYSGAARAGTIATKLKRDQLYEAFPDVDKNALDEIFVANNYDLRSSIWEVNAVYRESASPVKHVYSPEALAEMAAKEEARRKEQAEEDDNDCPDAVYQCTEQPDYDDYRAEATLHYKQRDECFKKAAKAYHAGQKDLALHYSTQGHQHSVRLKEANRRAAELIYQQRRQVTGDSKVDLHNLHVEEALQVLQEVLIEREQQMRRPPHPGMISSPGQNRYLEVVTGRGKHSQGGVAKLKPAVARFLEQKGYRYTIPNAGCLRVYLW